MCSAGDMANPGKETGGWEQPPAVVVTDSTTDTGNGPESVPGSEARPDVDFEHPAERVSARVVVIVLARRVRRILIQDVLDAACQREVVAKRIRHGKVVLPEVISLAEGFKAETARCCRSSVWHRAEQRGAEGGRCSFDIADLPACVQPVEVGFGVHRAPQLRIGEELRCQVVEAAAVFAVA